MPSPPRTIAIIGAGLAGLSAAKHLRQHDPSAQIHLFDKGRHPGGRMYTRTTQDGLDFEHGLQHIPAPTTAPQDDADAQLLDWLQRGLLTPQPQTPHQLIATRAWRALAQDLLAQAAPNTHHQNTQITHLSQPSPHAWQLHTAQGPIPTRFDALIITAPAPQSAKLIAPHLPALADQINTHAMTPRWVIMAQLNAPLHLPTLTDHPIIEHATREDLKPHRLPCPPQHERWTFITTSAFSQTHLEASPEHIEATILTALQPHSPTYLKAHRWRYAFASSPAQPLPQDPSTHLFLAGDWTHPKTNFHGAYLSGILAAQALLNHTSEAY